MQSRLEWTRSLPEKQILNYLSELVQSWIFLPSIPCLFNWVQLMRKILNWGCANDTPWTVSTRQIPNLHWQIFPVLSFLCRRLFFHSPTFMHNHTRSFTKRSKKLFSPSNKHAHQQARAPDETLVEGARRRKIRPTEITRQFFHFPSQGRRTSAPYTHGDNLWIFNDTAATAVNSLYVVECLNNVLAAAVLISSFGDIQQLITRWQM